MRHIRQCGGICVGDIINLRQARKQQKRKRAEAKAAANRTQHGLTRLQRTQQKNETDRRQRLLDGKKMDSGNGSEGDSGSSG